jgi:hypothetical protein
VVFRLFRCRTCSPRSSARGLRSVPTYFQSSKRERERLYLQTKQTRIISSNKLVERATSTTYCCKAHSEHTTSVSTERKTGLSETKRTTHGAKHRFSQGLPLCARTARAAAARRTSQPRTRPGASQQCVRNAEQPRKNQKMLRYAAVFAVVADEFVHLERALTDTAAQLHRLSNDDIEKHRGERLRSKNNQWRSGCYVGQF